jgi:pimeloyl-ACP methyl ester carboxylesterase
MRSVPIATIGDVDIHYRVRGDGPPVLGIIGFGLDQRFWAATIPAVIERHSFITFDNRGTGRSGTGPITLENMAADAVGLLDHLGIDKAAVFGVSMGGAIAQRIALDHPERVKALILAVTWARPIEFMRRQHEVARAILAGGGEEALLQASLIRMFTPAFFEVGREVVDQMVAAFSIEGQPTVASVETMQGQLDAVDKHDVLAELSQIECPTLVVGGKFDVMVPFLGAEEIAKAIPGAEFVSFESGHGLMVEEMDAFNAEVSRFLASLVNRP